MANTTDFVGAVYDQLVSLLGITDTVPSIIMQMAWPGFALFPQDFKRSETPNGSYDPDVATETFSHLANIVPVLSRPRYENSGYEVDDLYELLISSAIPSGATANTVETNPTTKLFNDAQFEFLQARRGVHDDPNTFYYPSTPTPANWYDEAAAQLWPTLNMTSTNIKPASPSSPFVKAGGVALVNQGVWKLRPTPANSTAIKMTVQQAAITKTLKISSTQPGMPGVVATPILNLHAADALRTVPGPTSQPMLGRAPAADASGPAGPVRTRPAIPIDSAVMRSTEFRDALGAARTSALFTPKAMPVSGFDRLGAKVQPLDLTQKRMDLSKVNMVDRLALSDLIDQQLPTKPPSTTDGFSISFKYSRVNIDRSWFKLALLTTKNWYIFGTKAGEYSTGGEGNSPCMFPLLPTSFVAIRDLKITANWSAEDKTTISNAAAFGFFDVRDSTFNSNTLEVKGLQILGWISRIMPQLPPMSPPT